MQDQAALRIEVVLVRDGLAHVAVLLRRAGRVELLQLQPVVDDRLEEVEGADRVRHHGLVRSVPRLPDMRLRAEVEDVGTVRRLQQLPDEVVDRRAVGQVGEVDPDPAAVRPDVVQRAARGRADERVHMSAERDERIREVRAHESVRPRDERRPAVEEVSELRAQLLDRSIGPDRVGVL